MRHGIPDLLVTDNGAQFSSVMSQKFTRTWDFSHRTSSPGYPKSNGQVENAVKTCKHLMKKARKAQTDPWLAVLDYRNTPTQGMSTSPAQRLMNRRTKTLLQTARALLQPKVTEEYLAIKQAKEQQKSYYDKTAIDLPVLKESQRVRIQPFTKSKTWEEATITKQLSDRCYEVQAPAGTTYRSNRVHLKATKEAEVKPITPERNYKNKTTNTTDKRKPRTAPTLKKTEAAEDKQKTQQTKSGSTIRRPSYLLHHVTVLFVYT